MPLTRRTLRRGVPLITLLAVAVACGDSDDASARLSEAAAYTLGTPSMSFAPADRRDEVEALIDTGPAEPEVTGEATVDDDGLVHDLAVGGHDGQQPAIEVTWKARVDDFGEPVDVAPPEDDQVVELDDVPALRDQVLGSS